MKTFAVILLMAICSVSSQAGTDPKPAASVSAESDHKKPVAEDKSSPAPATDESPVNKPADAPPELELKRKSSFQMEGDNRNPFWPIGWKPPEHVSTAAPEHATGDIPPTAFSVSSITMDSKTHFAIINGKVMEEGQQFGLQVGAQTYQLTVKSIEDGRVILSRRNQEIVVLLHRK